MFFRELNDEDPEWTFLSQMSEWKSANKSVQMDELKKQT